MLGACEAVALAGREVAAQACYQAQSETTAMWLCAAFLIAMAGVVGVGMWRRDDARKSR